jgi:hypothetical protein
VSFIGRARELIARVPGAKWVLLALALVATWFVAGWLAELTITVLSRTEVANLDR